MAEIIQFNQESDDLTAFKIEDDNGELKPMEEWTGDDWERLIEEAMTSIGTQMGISKWDAFAQFMKTLFETIQNQ